LVEVRAMTRLFAIKFSDGSHGALLSQEQARAAYDRIDSDRRPLCSVTTWIEGTPEEIVAKAIRDFGRAILHGDEKHRAWLTDAAERFLRCEEIRLPEKDEAVAPTLRPSAPVDDADQLGRGLARAIKNSAAVLDAMSADVDAPRSEQPTLTEER
jgi:hypothetical protein